MTNLGPAMPQYDSAYDSAQDISYASSARSAAGRAVIRLLENTTGRRALLRRAQGYDADLAAGHSFWQVMPQRFGLELRVTQGSLANIPAHGPLVVIANHPFGILDGLMLGHVLDRARPNFRILANGVFAQAKVLTDVLLPIHFDETRAALKANLHTRATALSYLGDGGAIGVFPGGTVSTSAQPFSRAMDPVWRNFTAKMIAKSGATVVPVYFEGQNSRLFQIASRLHQSLRLGLLIKEFRTRVDEPVSIRIGEPIDPDQIAALRHDPVALMRFLRDHTYGLSPGGKKPYDLGYEFEARYKPRT
jgi:putative hemolysin